MSGQLLKPTPKFYEKLSASRFAKQLSGLDWEGSLLHKKLWTQPTEWENTKYLLVRCDYDGYVQTLASALTEYFAGAPCCPVCGKLFWDPTFSKALRVLMTMKDGWHLIVDAVLEKQGGKFYDPDLLGFGFDMTEHEIEFHR